MYDLYQKFIHYNEYTNKWYAFNREEANWYLTDPKRMKSLKEYKTIEELLNDHKIKDNEL